VYVRIVASMMALLAFEGLPCFAVEPADDRPLAIPADTPAPTRPPPELDAPVPLPSGASSGPGSEVEVRPSQNAPKPKPQRPSNDRPSYLHLDAGYRVLWNQGGLMPVRQGPDFWRQRPHMLHASVGGLVGKKFYFGSRLEAPVNRARGTLPFVAEARFGWWDMALGPPEPKGSFKPIAGTAVTYLGARWVHGYFKGTGQEWAGTGSAGGLILGYTRSAPFGKATIVSDSQFSLYFLGWRDRNEFPVGLLNQRISVGFHPVFLDVQFRLDPALGQELSVGLSMQSLF
jgi:hypothetical protein